MRQVGVRTYGVPGHPRSGAAFPRRVIGHDEGHGKPSGFYAAISGVVRRDISNKLRPLEGRTPLITSAGRGVPNTTDVTQGGPFPTASRGNYVASGGPRRWRTNINRNRAGSAISPSVSRRPCSPGMATLCGEACFRCGVPVLSKRIVFSEGAEMR